MEQTPNRQKRCRQLPTTDRIERLRQEFAASMKNTIPFESYSPGTNDPAWWKCIDCGHIWQSGFRNRYLLGSNCRPCSYKTRFAGKKRTQTKRAPATEQRKALLGQEYSPKNSIPFELLKPTAKDTVYWQCSREGCGYMWTSQFRSRFMASGNCRKCASWASGDNNCATQSPDLVPEYSPCNPRPLSS